MLAIIGGSGLSQFAELDIVEEFNIQTPYGDCSSALVSARIGDRPIIFLPRHGGAHRLPPHMINYRANIWALKQIGATRVLAINAVGGIHHSMGPGTFVVPDQIIDYTYGRENSFNFLLDNYINHIDFTYPYCQTMRQELIASLLDAGLPLQQMGVYGCTQGPRLETAAEILRLQRDGCDLVGMTAMPEAALARELGLDYAALCLVVNWAAGVAAEELDMSEILKTLQQGMDDIKKTIFIFANQ
jgi:5'-methylthioinosine phosphorylase